MRRREFIALFASAIGAWPLAARAQQSVLSVIGFLSSRSPDEPASVVAAFRQGLNESGYFEGQNIAIEFRWAHGQYDRLPALAADLVGQQVALIVAAGGDVSALAAKTATSTIPVVFTGSDDPVRFGLVTSLNRPGGNVTGFSLIGAALETKRLELLHELIPQASAIAALINPNYPAAESQLKEVQEHADRLGVRPVMLTASTEREIDAAFATLVQQGAAALLVGNDPFFNSRREQLVALAARHALPAIYNQREFAAAGGLISYGASFTDNYRQVGIYVGKILKGVKPADLPVVQPTKFELVINLGTAQALGIEVPPSILLRADEVIE